MSLSIVVLAAVAQGADPEPPALDIPYERFHLKNGLDVILAPDASTPIVHVNVWYHVGSKDETAGLTGFAHLFEHLMFQGSVSQPGDYFDLLEAAGAQLNGSTTPDRTNYWETVPSEFLPLALYLESDRMGWLLDVLDQAKLDNQREVVRNERRQRYENPPYGTVGIELAAAVWPEDHPYHHTTIGSHEDLQNASLDAVKAFFRTWYAPDNASLVVSGDFDPKVTKKLIAEYFGGIPKGPPRVRPEVPAASIPANKDIREYQAVPEQRVWIAWISPKLLAPGDAELDLLSSVLTSGKDSRLYYRLVKDLKIAKDVRASQQSAMLGSTYVITATAAPGHTTDEVVAEIDRVLADVLGDHPPTTEELEAVKAGYQAGFFAGLATIQGKAETLQTYEYNTGDPGFLADDMQRYLDADATDVVAVAKDVLSKPRVVLHVWPEADRPGGAP